MVAAFPLVQPAYFEPVRAMNGVRLKKALVRKFGRAETIYLPRLVSDVVLCPKCGLGADYICHHGKFIRKFPIFRCPHDHLFQVRAWALAVPVTRLLHIT